MKISVEHTIEPKSKTLCGECRAQVVSGYSTLCSVFHEWFLWGKEGKRLIACKKYGYTKEK